MEDYEFLSSHNYHLEHEISDHYYYVGVFSSNGERFVIKRCSSEEYEMTKTISSRSRYDGMVKVVRPISLLQNGEDFFMVMEFVKGQTVADLIRTHMSGVEVDLLLHLSDKILEFEKEIGLVHGDLSLNNIIISSSSITLIDFERSRIDESESGEKDREKETDELHRYIRTLLHYTKSTNG